MNVKAYLSKQQYASHTMQFFSMRRIERVSGLDWVRKVDIRERLRLEGVLVGWKRKQVNLKTELNWIDRNGKKVDD